jgi:hypothetical protein
MPNTLTQDLRTTGCYLVSEAEGYRSREQIVVVSGSGVLMAGAVLGKINAGGTISAGQAANAGNTGGGTLTLANPAFAAGAKLGVYQATCTVGGADGTSKFRVEDPDGVVIGTATGGAEFNKAIKFTIAHATANFVVGDGFTVTLTQAADDDDGKYAPLTVAGTDGRQTAAAVLYEGCDATSVDVRRTITARDSEVTAGELTWPNAISDGDKAAALAALAARGIIAR